MRIDGSWHVCDDGVLRPIILAESQAADGSWLQLRLLVDVGADRTVISADVLRDLGFNAGGVTQSLEGVGGEALSVILPMQIRLMRENGTPVLFSGEFAAFTDPKALDMSVLGRDITNLFGVLVDRPQDIVCLAAGKHRCVLVEE